MSATIITAALAAATGACAVWAIAVAINEGGVAMAIAGMVNAGASGAAIGSLLGRRFP